MDGLAPETTKSSEAYLWLIISLLFLILPFFAAGIHHVRQSNEWQKEKHVSELSDDEIQDVARSRATGTVFFLLALFVVFMLTTWAGLSEASIGK